MWIETVVDSVNALNYKAQKLLFAELECRHGIPDDIVKEIRECELQRYGFGWVRWLWFATVARASR